MMFGKTHVKKELDIAKAAGKHAAHNVYYPFVFDGSRILYNRKECQDAYDPSTRSLKLVFKHLGIDNPMVNAIILYEGTLKGKLKRH